MDPEIVKKLGSSLLVPSVQELAKQGITKVPERYVRPNEDPCVEYDTTSLPQVPVIDLSKLLSEDDAAELEKLDHACKEWGFFQVWMIIIGLLCVFLCSMSFFIIYRLDCFYYFNFRTYYK